EPPWPRGHLHGCASRGGGLLGDWHGRGGAWFQGHETAPWLAGREENGRERGVSGALLPLSVGGLGRGTSRLPSKVRQVSFRRRRDGTTEQNKWRARPTSFLTEGPGSIH